MTDIAGSLTNSLDRGGKGGMLANLPMNGNRITGLAPGTESTDAATVGQIASGTSIPVGAVIDYWGTTPPDGYLLCYGQEVSRTTYASLFAVIGTTAGAGNGSTTFNVPDYRGRVSAGKDDAGGTAAGRLTTAGSGLNGTLLGAAGGTESVTLTEAQIPDHTHTFSATTSSGGAHTHTVGVSDNTEPGGSTGGGTHLTAGSLTTSTNGAHTHTVSGTTAGTGGGQAHRNVQPTIICNKIIRAS